VGIDNYLTEKGCARKIESAKSGYRASYSINKRALFNFVFRKKGLHTRVYGDNVMGYAGFPASMPESMIKVMVKSTDCKRLTVAPDACTPSCKMGYEFTINGEDLKKCRFNCFFFHVTDESLPYIKSLIENELAERIASQ
jgi:hypothetical protein